jgi:serine/threonine-protein kinase RsbW
MTKVREREFPGRFESLAEIGEFIRQAAEAAGLDERATYEVELAVDEACSNIIEHAYCCEDDSPPSERDDIQCTCRIGDEGLTIVLRDYGRPFDPQSVPEPDRDADLEEREVGGLGLYLMHRLMDEVGFEFTSDDGNVLTMVKRVEKTP